MVRSLSVPPGAESVDLSYGSYALSGKLALSVTTTLFSTWPSAYLLLSATILLCLLFANNEREQVRGGRWLKFQQPLPPALALPRSLDLRVLAAS